MEMWAYTLQKLISWGLSEQTALVGLSLSQQFSRGLLSHKEQRRELHPAKEVREVSGCVTKDIEDIAVREWSISRAPVPWQQAFCPSWVCLPHWGGAMAPFRCI